ncbi:hypothetical protein [Providencia huashanensis]|uniref:hypothetical protein n=1 Tax=Providencia huashanensis TaxID=3037798 RepID=UPI0040454683
MNTLAHIRLGLERIAFIITLILCFILTIILATHFSLEGLVLSPFAIPLFYLILYVLALTVPQCLAQLLLWVICAFRSIHYTFRLSPNLVSTTLSIIIGLIIVCALLMPSLKFVYFSSKSSAAVALFVEVLIAIGGGYWSHKKIRHYFLATQGEQP